jgi:hypothetical protein
MLQPVAAGSGGVGYAISNTKLLDSRTHALTLLVGSF